MANIPNPFAAPTELSNVVLIVQGKKLYATKEISGFLATHSPVLAAMFFGNFIENGKDEVELKEVKYQEFVDLLTVIHPGYTPIKEATVSHILKLADQFEMKDAREKCENFLLKTFKVNKGQRIILAAQYKLEKLMIQCCKSITCINELTGIQYLSVYNGLSDGVKIMICDRIMELILPNGQWRCAVNHACRCLGDSSVPVSSWRAHRKQIMAEVTNPFADPTEFSNVILIVEGQKLHVNKDYLAIHSPVMAVMFNGNFAEKGKDEIEMKDVVHSEFVDILKIIHPGYSPITATSVFHILKLADRFEMKEALDQSELFLLSTRDVKIETKLFLSDQYNLKKLKNFCLNSFTCVFALRVIKASPDYANLSEGMKMAILERMMELISVNSPAHVNSAHCRCGCRPVSDVTVAHF